MFRKVICLEYAANIKNYFNIYIISLSIIYFWSLVSIIKQVDLLVLEKQEK